MKGASKVFERFGLRSVLLLLLLVCAESAYAQAYGRVTVVVKNPKGEPLQGVKVVVTSQDLERFEEESLTNKKGKAIFSFTDATKTYDFRFEFEDYQPADMKIKPQIRSTITREVVLSEGQVITTNTGGSESRTVYSPAERVFNEGVLALQSQDMATAKTKFLEALEKNKDMSLAHSALAGVYMEEGNAEAALASISKFLELEPSNPRGLRLLYEAHKGLGNDSEAESVLKELSKLDQGGDTVAMIYNEGVAAVKVGDLSRGKEKFLEALEIDPNLKEAVGALAVIHFQEASYKEAAAMTERHLVLEPNHQRSLRIRWDAYRELDDQENAAAALKALADVDPTVLIAEFYNKGNQLFDNGDIPGAIQEFKRILAIDPDHPRAHYRLGVCNVSSGNSAEAKTHLNRFMELAPDDPEAPVAKEMLAYLKN